MGAEKRLNSTSPGVVPHWGRGDKVGFKSPWQARAQWLAQASLARAA